jgi:hypothetical protein
VNKTVHGIPEARDSVNAGELKRKCNVVVAIYRAIHVCPFFHPQNNPSEIFLPIFSVGGSNFCAQLGSIPNCGGIFVKIFPSK